MEACRNDEHEWEEGYCVWCGMQKRDYVRITQLEEERDALVVALKEITKCEGAFSMDKLTHAENVIDNLVDIAEKAIEATS